MKVMKSFGLGILLTSILAGCNFPSPFLRTTTPEPVTIPTSVPTLAPTAVPVPAQTGAECLVGTWELQGLADFITAILPQEVLEENQVIYEGVTGKILYTFGPNGQVTATPEDLIIQAKAQRGFISVLLDATLEGSASASYEVDDTANQIHFSNPRNNSLTLTVKVGGVRVVDDLELDSMMVFGGEGEPEALVDYQCTGNSLRFTVDFGEVTGSRILSLTRTQ